MIKLNNVCKTYDDFSLKGVNIDIEPGYIYGFVGKNGSGKTTTIRLMMGVIDKLEGEIKYFDGLSVENAKKRIGFVYDDCAYYEHLSGEKMAQVISRFYENWDWNIFHQRIENFEIPLKKRIENYSKGMKVKFSLACALSHNPDVLVLDEPTSGLDPVFRNELLAIFQEYIEDGSKSVFFSTHITSDLEKVADYVYFIDNGEIKLESTSEALKYDFALVKGPREELEKISDIAIGIEHSKYQSQCIVSNRAYVEHLQDSGCYIESPSYEDILIHFIKEGSHEGTIIKRLDNNQRK